MRWRHRPATLLGEDKAEFVADRCGIALAASPSRPRPGSFGSRIWQPTSPEVAPPLDRQFGGLREVRKVRELREQVRTPSSSYFPQFSHFPQSHPTALD